MHMSKTTRRDIMKHTFDFRYRVPGTLASLVAAFLAACSTPAPPPAAPAAAPAVQPPAQAKIAPAHKSNAPTPKAYRADAATHLYGLNKERIYKGRMPPLLYAIGVLQVEVDGRGNVRDLSWMRAPKHAPEVIAEIERTVRAAAPFPAPVRMGKVVYTDTWLWHKSGRFQLDTLTEGQD
jgi:periplasmic protein TonB